MPGVIVNPNQFPYTFPIVFGESQATRIEDSPAVRAPDYSYLYQTMFGDFSVPVGPDPDDPEVPVWHFNRDPVWPVEYRYLLPSVFYEPDPITAEPAVDDPTVPVWHFTPAPVWPTEYRYLLPSVFFQGEPSDFVTPDTIAEEGAWFQPTNQPVRPVEYRYMIENIFQWLAIVLIDQGILVTLPRRQLTAELRPRTLTAGLEGTGRGQQFRL